MVQSFTQLKRIRKSFGRLPEVAPMPNLIEVQKQSYDRFLEPMESNGTSLPSGLEEAFRTVFPIKDFSGRSQLEFVSYELENPKYDVAFYFKCSLKVAAYRRWLDLKKSVPLKEVKKSLKIRTNLDKKRKNSPLIKVKDAILIRTDNLSKKQVLKKMSDYIEKLN